MTTLVVLIEGVKPFVCTGSSEIRKTPPLCDGCRGELHANEFKTGLCVPCRTRILRRLRVGSVTQPNQSAKGGA